MRRSVLAVIALLLALSPALGTGPALAGPAMTDTTYFDGFLDLVGIDPFQSMDIELDALGGVRMKGNGASEPAGWTAQSDFQAAISYKPALFIDDPPIPLATLDAATAPGSLVLPSTPHAFRRVSAEPVLLPAVAASVDGYGVAGMCVRRVDLPGARYYMWYTGVPENESAARIYLAKSDNGVAWTRVPKLDPDTGLEVPVLDLGAPGTFDSRQLGKPSVLYDPAGTPKFRMWYSAEGDLTGSIGYATSEDGLVWTKWEQAIATLDGAAGDVGQHASLAVGADGLPVVAYYDAGNADLKLVHCGNAFCSDGNTVVTLDATGDVGRFASLAVAGDGLPVVAYYDATNGDLKVAHCGTAACMVGNSVSTVDGAGGSDVGQHASLAVDANGYPLIAYHDFTNKDLKFIGCTDYACAGGDELPATVDGAAADVGEYASLALIARSPLAPTTLTPAIVYYDATNTDLKFVACNDALCAGGDETPVVLDASADDVGKFASLAVSPAGRPAIAYHDATAVTLKFVACNDALCAGADDTPIVLDPTPGTGSFSRLVFGADGFPVVGYYDAANGDLLAIACNDPACAGGDDAPFLVDDGGDVGRDLSLALLPGGAPHFAYYDATNGDLLFTASRREPLPVLGPGIIGSVDSFSVAHPSVIFDSGIYRMWYTANDSNNRRIAYASSSDGVTWARGGLVIDVGGGNIAHGVWAPSVTMDADGYTMVFTGWKVVAGSMTVQSKLLEATSADGTDWSYNSGGVMLNPGNDSTFDGNNLSQGAIIYDPLDTAKPYKMWYVGNTIDPVTGAFHDRIGYANKADTGSWGKVAGAAGFNAVLGLGPQSAAFDSMYAYDLRVVPDPAVPGRLLGFSTGRNAADSKDRIGVVESMDDGATWEDHISPDPLVQVGGAGAFDEGGIPTPAPVFLGAGSGWLIYHTALDGSLAPSLALHTAPDGLSASTSAGQVTLTGGAFDTGGRTDPFAVLDGTALTLFYAGLDADETGSICMAAGTTATPAAFGAATQILSPAPRRTTRAACAAPSRGATRRPRPGSSGTPRLVPTASSASRTPRPPTARSGRRPAWPSRRPARPTILPSRAPGRARPGRTRPGASRWRSRASTASAGAAPGCSLRPGRGVWKARPRPIRSPTTRRSPPRGTSPATGGRSRGTRRPSRREAGSKYG